MESETDKQIRTQNIIVRVTPEEKKLIEERAKKAHCNISFYARTMLIHGHFFNISDEEKIIFRSIGNNVNQISRRVNSGDIPPNLRATLKEIEDQIKPFYKQNADRKNRTKES